MGMEGLHDMSALEQRYPGYREAKQIDDYERRYMKLVTLVRRLSILQTLGEVPANCGVQLAAWETTFLRPQGVFSDDKLSFYCC